jgi:hypothetical protein
VPAGVAVAVTIGVAGVLPPPPPPPHAAVVNATTTRATIAKRLTIKTGSSMRTKWYLRLGSLM